MTLGSSVVSSLDATRLPLHFDVPHHSLPADDFIIAVKALHTALLEINNRLLNEAFVCELLVFPTEDGSLKAVLGIIARSTKTSAQVAAILAALISFLETDTAKGFTKGLTGHDINYYKIAENTGIFLRDIIVGVFTKETDDLHKIIPREINLDKVLVAKSQFYKKCIDNQEIRAIGFRDNGFDVSRDRFLYHTTTDLIRPLPPQYETMELIVVSPINIDKEGQWSFIFPKNKFSFRAFMDDEKFKREYLNGHYPMKKSKSDDLMSVLVEHQRQEKNGEVEIIRRAIHSVNKFNDIVINTDELAIEREQQKRARKMLPFESLWGIVE